jgi:hypothetical protein
MLHLQALRQHTIMAAPLRLLNNGVYASVVFDNSAPSGVRLSVGPREWVRGQPLLVKASADDRKNLAPITRAFFFFGKQPPDGKLPADALPGELDEKTGSWVAELPTDEKSGKHEISVLLETVTGGKAIKSDFVVFKDAKVAPEAGKKTVTIKGQITHGSAALPKAEVFLLDAKLWQKKAEGAVKEQGKSDDKGEFIFDNVPPGEYAVAARQRAPFELTGYVMVTVTPEGKLLNDKKQDITTLKVPVLAK